MPGNGLNIWILCQNLALQNQLKMLITGEGLQIRWEAQIPKPEDPALESADLVILDAEHPEISGFHWLESIRKFPIHRQLPVIVLSAFISEPQFESFQKHYPDSPQMLVRVPLAKSSFQSVFNYFLERLNRQKQLGLEQGITLDAEQAESSLADALAEHLSLQDLYERQKFKEQQEDLAKTTEPPVLPAPSARPESIDRETDVETLHRYIAMKEEDLSRLSQAFGRLSDRLDQAYAMADRLRLELSQAAKQRDEAEIKSLSLQDEMERFRMKAEREKQALIEDFQIKMAQKELLEGDHQELLTRFEALKRRMAHEIKEVRTHERELEHQIQMVRSDTQTLLEAKDQKILELTKKIESLYERIANLSDKIRGSEAWVSSQVDKQGRVLKALRLASSLLEPPPSPESKKRAA
jgi:CheY-like chemotaxis protein